MPRRRGHAPARPPGLAPPPLRGPAGEPGSAAWPGRPHSRAHRAACGQATRGQGVAGPWRAYAFPVLGAIGRDRASQNIVLQPSRAFQPAGQHLPAQQLSARLATYLLWLPAALCGAPGRATGPPATQQQRCERGSGPRRVGATTSRLLTQSLAAAPRRPSPSSCPPCPARPPCLLRSSGQNRAVGGQPGPASTPASQREHGWRQSKASAHDMHLSTTYLLWASDHLFLQRLHRVGSISNSCLFFTFVSGQLILSRGSM